MIARHSRNDSLIAMLALGDENTAKVICAEVKKRELRDTRLLTRFCYSTEIPDLFVRDRRTEMCKKEKSFTGTMELVLRTLVDMNLPIGSVEGV